MDGQRHTPAASPPEKKASAHYVGDWAGPRAGLLAENYKHTLQSKDYHYSYQRHF